jgi:hypothetical protein
LIWHGPGHCFRGLSVKRIIRLLFKLRSWEPEALGLSSGGL